MCAESNADLPRWDKTVLRWRILQFLGIAAALSILAVLLLPALQVTRAPTRRSYCINNLKLIALGLLNYESTYGELPPAYTVDADGRPLHSWRTLILPFVEGLSVHKRIDLTKPWDDPANKDVMEMPFAPYICPSLDRPAHHTTYLAVVVPGGCIRPTEGRKLADITDGEERTIMLIEVDAEHSVPWMCPQDADLDLIYSLASSDSLAHEGETTVVFVDGRARPLSVTTDRKKIRAMISIAGGDEAELQD